MVMGYMMMMGHEEYLFGIGLRFWFKVVVNIELVMINFEMIIGCGAWSCLF
jgi:hypothetical protein